MRHVDLFSGIGGFALAAKWVWGDDYRNVLFCDNNRFCQEVIKKNFGKDSLIYGDIKEITVERLIADTTSERCNNWGNNRQTGHVQEVAERGVQEDQQARHRWISGFGATPVIDILTGGFPCQGFSEAGKRRGTKDDRYLWPEMYRVIKDLKPRWVVAENVRGILVTEGGVVFEQVHLDLEAEGYEVRAFVIPACAVNAPHRRDRVWFVAHARYWDGQRIENQREFGGQVFGTQDAAEPERSNSDALEGSVADSKGVVCSRGEPSGDRQGRSKEPVGDESGYDSDSGVQGLEGRECVHTEGCDGQLGGDGSDERRNWEQNWFEVASRICGMDDGLPCELDGLKLTKSKHRIERLKALGNAIVPQVAAEIFKAIKYVDTIPY